MKHGAVNGMTTSGIEQAFAKQATCGQHSASIAWRPLSATSQLSIWIPAPPQSLSLQRRYGGVVVMAPHVLPSARGSTKEKPEHERLRQ